MSKEQKKEKEGGGVAAKGAAEFVVAKVGGKVVRFPNVESVPEGVEAITPETVAEMTKDAIGELYGAVAGVGPKKFKDKKVATESLAYQIAKMPVFDPNAPKPEPAVKTAKGAKASAEGGKYARKAADSFELLQPAESEKVLRSLAPQARELVLIMTDLAKEKGATSFSGNDLGEYLKKPEVAARLRTRQDPLRILQYYRAKLISVGLVRVS